MGYGQTAGWVSDGLHDDLGRGLGADHDLVAVYLQGYSPLEGGHLGHFHGPGWRDVVLVQVFQELSILLRHPFHHNGLSLGDLVKGIEVGAEMFDAIVAIAPGYGVAMGACGGVAQERHQSICNLWRDTVLQAVGLGIGLVFWATHSVGISLGRSGALLPVIAGWIACIMFLLVSLNFFLKVRY